MTQPDGYLAAHRWRQEASRSGVDDDHRHRARLVRRHPLLGPGQPLIDTARGPAGAYLGLLETAESCIDIANRPVVLGDYAEWLAGGDTVSTTVPPTSDDQRETPASVIEANERRQLCGQLLGTAAGAIDLLTEDDEILTAASDLAQSASVLHSVELSALEASAQYEPDSPEADFARESLDQATSDYESKLATFTTVAGDDTRSFRGWWGTLWPAGVAVVGALVVGVLVRRVLAWLLGLRWVQRLLG